MAQQSAAASELDIRVLGPVGAFCGGSRIDVRGSRPLATLSVLALRVGERVSTLAHDVHAEQAVVVLRRGLELWHGKPLASVPLTPMLRAWVADLEERRCEALERCLGFELELGRHAQVVGELSGLVAGAPLRERPRALLMLALYRCGRHADALATYREGRKLLVDELGIEPHRELRELEQAILCQDSSLSIGVPSQPYR